MFLLKHILKFISLVLLIIPINVDGQIAWRHATDLDRIVSDSLGQLYFKDADNQYYGFHDQRRFINLKTLSSEVQVKFNVGKINHEYYLNGNQVKLTESCIISGLDTELRQLCKSFVFSCAAIYKDGMLLGSEQNGLWIFDENAIRKYFINGVYFPQDIKDIQVTKGRIWILSQSGGLYLFDIYLQTLKAIDASIDVFHVDQWDVLWTGRKNNLRKDVRFINNSPPLLKLKTDNNLKLTDENVSIDYDASYSPDPSALKIEYSINNGGWATFPNDGKLHLEYLNPGSQIIKMRASNQDLHSKEQSLRYSFELSWWETYWPYIFGILLTLILLAFFSQLIQSRSRSRLIAETETIRQELKNLQLKQKMGQLQMNPHFIFNVLNSISGLIAIGNQREARKCLNSFAQMMRTTLDASTKDHITVGEEIEFLNHYLSLEQMAHGQKFDFEIKNDLDPGLLIPPMLIQPFIENAILHGIKHKTGYGNIEIDLKLEEEFVKVKILDDGIGRKASSQFRNEGHDSHALNIINERISALARRKKKDFINIEDLESINGEPLGTKVTILIPYKSR